MKIQCQSCQAKYTIADEKVLGKVVKIRCKKCSSTIVINGNDHAAAGGDAGGDANAFDYAGGAGGDAWTVNVADGDQRTMTVAEIAAEYRNGVVNDETYCWKDGMADWLPLRDVAEIFAQLKGGGGREEMMSVSPAASVPPPAAAANLFAAPAPAADAFAGSVSPKPAGTNGSGGLFAGGGGGGGTAAMETAPAAAARRAGGRGQGGDLFGNVEKAGGEDDVMTSAANAAVAANVAAAAATGAAPPVHDEKLTGQRNENSVLFSLSALTDKKPEGGSSSSSSSSSSSGNGNRTTASADGSGLIDIRALSANMDDEGTKKKDKGARVDDIMNLSGGGAFGAALAAPILAPPPLEPMDLGVSTPMEQPKQSKTLVFAILGGCAFIAIGIVVAVIMTRPPAAGDKSANPTGSNSASPDTTGSVASTAAPTDSSNAAGAGSTADNTPPAPGTGNKPGSTPAGGVHPGAATPGGHPAAGHPGAVAAAGGGDSTPAAPTPAAPAKPQSLADSMAAAAGQPAAPAGGGGGGGSSASFDKGAAAGSLGKIDVQGCKKSDGPTGPGHVTVTFQPDGSVQSAVVDQGPYPGTPVGGCVAGRFKGAHVPAFAGAPVRVGKSFIIN